MLKENLKNKKTTNRNDINLWIDYIPNFTEIKMFFVVSLKNIKLKLL
jgi:hypothetical protein